MSSSQLTEEKIKQHAKIFELQLKARAGLLTTEEEDYLSRIACSRSYGDTIMDAIIDLSYDVSSGKLSRFKL